MFIVWQFVFKSYLCSLQYSSSWYESCEKPSTLKIIMFQNPTVLILVMIVTTSWRTCSLDNRWHEVGSILAWLNLVQILKCVYCYMVNGLNPGGISCLSCVIVLVRVVFRKTIVVIFRAKWGDGIYGHGFDWSVLLWCDWSSKCKSCSDWSYNSLSKELSPGQWHKINKANLSDPNRVLVCQYKHPMSM